MDEYIGHEDLRAEAAADSWQRRRRSANVLQQAAEGPNTVLGAGDVKGDEDPILGGANILVADDEPNIRDDDQRRAAEISGEGHGRRQRRRGDRQLLEKQQFDLVLSDIKMPDKTGYEVFAAAGTVSRTVR